MAYLDIAPNGLPNGKTVVLFHGKAFGCYYFHNVIEALTGSGYLVLAPTRSAGVSHPSPMCTTASSSSLRTPQLYWITSGSEMSLSWAIPPGP